MRWIRLILSVAAVATMTLFAPLPAHADGRAVVFVIDTSGSMKGEKIEAAKSAVAGLISAIPEDVAIGLVAFNSLPKVVASPSLDRDMVLRGLDLLSVGGDTALFDAILIGRAAVADASKAVVVVVSDGEDTASGLVLEDVQTADWSAVQLSVVGVDIATFGSFRGQFEELVTSTGGSLVSVDEVSLLADVLRETLRLSGILPSGEPELTETPVPTLALSRDLGGTAVHISLAVGVGVSLFYLFFSSASLRAARKRERQRSAVLSAFSQLDSAVTHKRAIPIPAFLRKRNEGLVEALDAAALNWTPESYRYRQLALWFATAMLLLILSAPPLVALIGASLVGVILPRRYLARLARKRQASFRSELPDFLSISASALRAGLPVTQALQSASKDSDGELGRQMARALQEMAIGATLDTALQGVARRVESEDFAWLVTALDVQRRIGGNLSEILDVAAATVRSRLELQQEVKTLAAEGLLSARVLIALPIGVLLFLILTRRDFVSPLWQSGVGLGILGAAAGLVIGGYLWIKRLSTLEV